MSADIWTKEDFAAKLSVLANKLESLKIEIQQMKLDALDTEDDSVVE